MEPSSAASFHINIRARTRTQSLCLRACLRVCWPEADKRDARRQIGVRVDSCEAYWCTRVFASSHTTTAAVAAVGLRLDARADVLANARIWFHQSYGFSWPFEREPARSPMIGLKSLVCGHLAAAAAALMSLSAFLARARLKRVSVGHSLAKFDRRLSCVRACLRERVHPRARVSANDSRLCEITMRRRGSCFARLQERLDSRPAPVDRARELHTTPNVRCA